MCRNKVGPSLLDIVYVKIREHNNDNSKDLSACARQLCLLSLYMDYFVIVCMFVFIIFSLLLVSVWRMNAEHDNLPCKFVVVVLLARRRLRLTSARNAAVTATRRVESVTAARSRDATISRWSSVHYAAHRATTTDSFCAKHAPPTITTLPTFSCCQCAAPVSVF